MHLFGIFWVFLALGLFLWCLAGLLPAPTAKQVCHIAAVAIFFVDVILAIIGYAP